MLATIKVTRMGASVITGENPVIHLAHKAINYITQDEVGHCKIIMHRGAIKVEETKEWVLKELLKQVQK